MDNAKEGTCFLLGIAQFFTPLERSSGMPLLRLNLCNIFDYRTAFGLHGRRQRTLFISEAGAQPCDFGSEGEAFSFGMYGESTCQLYRFIAEFGCSFHVS